MDHSTEDAFLSADERPEETGIETGIKKTGIDIKKSFHIVGENGNNENSKDLKNDVSASVRNDALSMFKNRVPSPHEGSPIPEKRQTERDPSDHDIMRSDSTKLVTTSSNLVDMTVFSDYGQDISQDISQEKEEKIEKRNEKDEKSTPLEQKSQPSDQKMISSQEKRLSGGPGFLIHSDGSRVTYYSSIPDVNVESPLNVGNSDKSFGTFGSSNNVLGSQPSNGSQPSIVAASNIVLGSHTIGGSSGSTYIGRSSSGSAFVGSGTAGSPKRSRPRMIVGSLDDLESLQTSRRGSSMNEPTESTKFSESGRIQRVSLVESSKSLVEGIDSKSRSMEGGQDRDPNSAANTRSRIDSNLSQDNSADPQYGTFSKAEAGKFEGTSGVRYSFSSVSKGSPPAAPELSGSMPELSDANRSPVAVTFSPSSKLNAVSPSSKLSGVTSSNFSGLSPSSSSSLTNRDHCTASSLPNKDFSISPSTKTPLSAIERLETELRLQATDCLERMNSSSEMLNRFETGREISQKRYENLQKDWNLVYAQMRRECGLAIDRSRPYFEAEEIKITAESNMHQALRNFTYKQTAADQEKKELAKLEEEITMRSKRGRGSSPNRGILSATRGSQSSSRRGNKDSSFDTVDNPKASSLNPKAAFKASPLFLNTSPETSSDDSFHEQQLDTEQQEKLSVMNINLMRVLKEKEVASQEYANCLRVFEQSSKKLHTEFQKIPTKLIEEARPCFERMNYYRKELYALSQQVMENESKAIEARSNYNATLRMLENINEKIHEVRQNEKAMEAGENPAISE